MESKDVEPELLNLCGGLKLAIRLRKLSRIVVSVLKVVQ